MLKTNARCTAIDRAAREVVAGGKRVPYDALVIATGSLMRELALLPPGVPRVHYLRTDEQARMLKADLARCKHLAVIGAGLIGLEVAASAAELGIQVTVIEFAPRVMSRACDEETAAAVLAEHQHRGVEIEVSTAVTQVTPQLDGTIALETGAGDIFAVDIVVVGVGVMPDVALAEAAGLRVLDGIVVDEHCRTSDPIIFAAGDCTRFPGGLGGLARLENWRHAQDHGAVAGRNAAGASDSYNTPPSFWSEQYDLYIQGVGWPDDGAQKIRRPLSGKSTLLLECRDGVLRHAIGINAQRDLAAVRRLIERRIPVDAAALADPAQPFAAMLKASA
jgi:NADPH-dependent 2,4-dienoyl-CoA reductase/sulfur reductase-like enzyme